MNSFCQRSNNSWMIIFTGTLFIAVLMVCLQSTFAGQPNDGNVKPVRVTIRDEKPVVVEPVLPVDERVYIRLAWSGRMNYSPFVENKRMVFSSSGGIMTKFKIDGALVDPNTIGGRLGANNRQPLQQRPGRRKRQGWQCEFNHGKIHIKQIVELVPTQPPGKRLPGQKRRIDAALVRYFIENKDTRPHEIGMRLALDTLLVDNDGCLWAAPNQPGKILNGVEIKEKMIPNYLQVLQRPNLQNPGYVAHWTFNLGRGRERPTRLVLTRHGNEYTPWDVVAQPSFGDTGMAIFWDPRKVPAGSTVEFAYAYGQGLAGNPENEGKVGVVFGGSFEPGRLFTISAHVMDPIPGQWLQLKLPAGMKSMEGNAVQAVPEPSENGSSIVMWKARVERTGNFAIRVRSSTGVTQTKMIAISR